MAIKEFGKLSEDQLKQLYANLFGAMQDIDYFNSLLKNPSLEFVEIVDNMPPWAFCYELEYPLFLSLYLYSIGLLDTLKASVQLDDPQSYWLAFVGSEEEQQMSFDQYSAEEKSIIFALTYATSVQIYSCRLFHVPMSELVRRSREGDDNALFNAVLIDSTAVTCPSIALRIHQAKLRSDNAFFDHLAAAIKGNRPRRPDEKHDDLRFMLAALSEAIELGKLSNKQLSDLFIDKLQLYSDSGGDPEGSLKKFIQRRNKDSGT